MGGSPFTRKSSEFSLARNGYSAYAMSTRPVSTNVERYPRFPVRRVKSRAAFDAPAFFTWAANQSGNFAPALPHAAFTRSRNPSGGFQTASGPIGVGVFALAANAATEPVAATAVAARNAAMRGRESILPP